MAAYTACMCLVRKCHSLSTSTSFVTLFRNNGHCFRANILANKSIPNSASVILLYSTQKSNEIRGLTDEILKDKLKTDRETKGKEESGSEGTSRKEKFKSKWMGKNAWKLGLILMGAWGVSTIGGLIYIWGSPPTDPDGNIVSDEFSEFSPVPAYIQRASKEFSALRKTIQDPSREKLLPEPLKYPYVQPPYTLVLEMTGVLVHPDWTYGTGWRFKKRPGVEYFLEQVGPPLFEVVIYTAEQGMTGDPILNTLDPKGYVMYRLYRDATRYMGGHHVKDLSCLNRDLSKVIIVDWNKHAYQLQPRNAFPVKKWNGGDSDRTLIDLAHFLKTIATSGVDDIRPVMDYYSQFDDPIGMFKENQKKLQIEQDTVRSEQKMKTKSWSFNPFGR